ncbi:WhiB family transcriptional regulator [Microbacterium sp. NEAU-LLC]|uniref:WhiB family transcriptional regulator n=1 Tax=Microbacterium helvum TaxID=2773713 RepID=A0ABR8NRM3_9MICO|nr:WhiB family transcriptional regulator [Microbacterium helvum]MBD3942809.1 WhiB family transcriptional regulator [Microbacterium helvum]
MARRDRPRDARARRLMGAKADAAYLALSHALDEIDAPPCTDDPRFILDIDQLAPGEAAFLGRTVCNTCPIKWACIAYAEAARPSAGIWAGRTYKPRKLADPEPHAPDTVPNPKEDR